MADPIKISDLTALPAPYQMTDWLRFQRQGGGVWRDFKIDVSTLIGPVKLAVIEWDMSASLLEYISADTPGNMLIIIDGIALFTPGSFTPGTGTAINVYNVSTSAGQYNLPITIGADAYATMLCPTNDPATDLYDGLTSDIAVELSVAPATFDSSMRILILYIEKEPI